MNNRNQRKKIAEDTLDILDKGYYQTKAGKVIEIKNIIENSVKQSKLYSPILSDELILNRQNSNAKFITSFEVMRGTTLDCVRKLNSEGLKNILYLNFASAKNPGGGFLGGSQAQEESIARSTGIYPSLLANFEYYEVNRNHKSCFYTDYIIYSPKVPIFKNEEGELLEDLVIADVITAPAVNAGIVLKQEPEKESEIESVMKRRMEKILAIALENNRENIVLGAWGCGVFRNEPAKVSKWFKEVINAKFSNSFKNIVFAIYARDDRFINPFIKDFAS